MVGITSEEHTGLYLLEKYSHKNMYAGIIIQTEHVIFRTLSTHRYCCMYTLLVRKEAIQLAERGVLGIGKGKEEC